MLEPPRAWGLTLTSLLASCSPPLSALPLSPSLSLSLSLSLSVRSTCHCFTERAKMLQCNTYGNSIYLFFVRSFHGLKIQQHMFQFESLNINKTRKKSKIIHRDIQKFHKEFQIFQNCSISQQSDFFSNYNNEFHISFIYS